MTEQKRTREDVKRSRQRQKKTPQKKASFGTWFKRIFITAFIVGILTLIGGAGLFAYYVSKAPELDEELLKDPISSEFYDKDGELFATIGIDEKRKYINYEDIPQEMVEAIVATEDARFFEHSGIDFRRIGGAVIANLRDRGYSQGASTITQQVIKNSFFSNEKKLERKAQEAWLAIQLERKYDKEEIFEMYFNKVLMSGTTYGFGTAAEYFYGKEDLNELTLDEMALLAGMPQSPNNYNPIKNPESAEKRRNIVLGLMVQHGKITKAEADEAKLADVTAGLLPEEERTQMYATEYGAFLDVVLSEIETNGDYGLLSEGVKVYTTLDRNAQKIVEDVMNNAANFPTETIESGVAVIDTKTGALSAIGGGRNYGNREYNYAYDLKTRSPGSTIKPLIDYGPAFEYLKWSTGETLVDEPINYSGSSQTITNWDSRYNGTMTLRKALYTSRNVPAVKTLRAVGMDNAKEFVNKLGIDAKEIVESDALGGGKISMSPIQMAASYAAFGNGGRYTDAHSITKIVYRDNVTTKKYKPESTFAMSDSTAYMVTDVLRDTISGHSDSFAQNAYVPGIDIAGKTGTTNYSRDEFSKYNLKSGSVPDSWFAGYSPNYSIAIWSGYSERKDAITSWDERWLPQRLFKYIMSDLKDLVPNETFQKPSSVVEATIEIGSSPLKLASEYTPADKRSTELFVKGTVPTETSTEYEAAGIEAPYNVRADYNDAANAITVSWAHNDTPPAEGEEPKLYTYEVSMKVGDAPATVISTTGSKEVIVPNVQPGTNYQFFVVATDGTERSEPGTASIFIDGEITAIEPENPDVENPETPDGEQEEPEETPPGTPNTPTPPVTPPGNNGTSNGAGNGTGGTPGNGSGNGNNNNTGNGTGETDVNGTPNPN